MSRLVPISPDFTARVELCPLDRRYAVVDLEFATRLRTEHSRRFEIAADAGGGEQFTRDVPNVGEDDLAHLDEAGLARVGAAVAPGTILVGKATALAGVTLTPEEKLLRAIFGEAAGSMRDSSLRAPPGCSGVVTAARVEGGEAIVEVAWERRLEVGDVLLVDGQPVVVAGIRELGADLAWSGGGAEVSVAKAAMARDVLHARSIGPYSATTQQPTVGRERFGGQPLERGQVERLATHVPWALWEMLTIKSDSVTGRMRAYESIVKGESPDVLPQRREPGAAVESSGGVQDIFSFFEAPRALAPDEVAALQPEAATLLVAHLHALGLVVDLRAAEVGLAIATSEELRERSHGAVREPTPEGLSCPKIFGPVKDYACACGKYVRMKHRGVVCEECGVEVISSRVRRERFGHVELAAPCLHPLFAGEAATLLGLTEDEVRDVVAGRRALESMGGRAWRTVGGEADGGRALWDALAQLDLTALAAGAGARAELASALERTGRPATALMLTVVPVLPPELRRDDESELTALYCEVVARNDEVARLAETGAPELARELAQLQRAIDRLMLDGRPAIAARIAELLAGGVFTKSVDFSGVAHLVVDPSLAPGECRVSYEMLMELFKPHAFGILEVRGYVTTIKSAKRMVDARRPEAAAAVEEASDGYPVLLMAGTNIVCRRVRGWDAPAVAVDPATAERMASHTATVHVPLMHEAALQCERLADFPTARRSSTDGWLCRARQRHWLLTAARSAALHGERDRLDDPVVQLALGRFPESVEASERERWAERERERREQVWERARSEAPDEAPSRDPNLDRRIDELELSVASYRLLDGAGVQTIGELCSRTEMDLLKMRGFGRRQLAEIKQILAELGLSLGMRDASS